MMNGRIGVRNHVDVRDVLWLPEGDERGRFRLRRPAPLTATLVDLSFTGAALIAPAGVQVGRRVSIAVGQGQGIVTVRRSVPLRGTPLEQYGVEFLSLDNELRDVIVRTLDAHDPETAWRWSIGR
jgi:hypothetical protein